MKYVQLSQQISTRSKSKIETLEKRSTTALNPRHLKGKRYDIHLTKNYCITISIQKINWIHKFNLKIQQILGSHELKGHGHFRPRPPKNFWLNFYHSWICTTNNQLIPSVHFWDTVNFTHCSLRRARAGTHASKFTCAIYRTGEIIVFSLFALLLLYISGKEKLYIEKYFIEVYIQEI